jgi:hypothetical protein
VTSSFVGAKMHEPEGVRGGRVPPPERFRVHRDYTERMFPSTTFEWRKVRVFGPSPGGSSLAAGQSALSSLRRRNPVKPLTVTLWATGSDLRSFEIRCRGITWRFPDGTYLFDVVTALNNWV